MAFSDTLRMLRKQNGFTQKDLAEKVSEKLGYPVHRPTITKWESGTHEPPAWTLKQLAEIFDVTVDYLLGVEYENDAEDFTTALQNRPMLKQLVAQLLHEDDEKIRALCVLAGVGLSNTGE